MADYVVTVQDTLTEKSMKITKMDAEEIDRIFQDRVTQLLRDNRLWLTKDIAYITGISEVEVLDIIRRDSSLFRFTEPQVCLQTRAEIVEVDPNGLKGLAQ